MVDFSFQNYMKDKQMNAIFLAPMMPGQVEPWIWHDIKIHEHSEGSKLSSKCDEHISCIEPLDLDVVFLQFDPQW